MTESLIAVEDILFNEARQTILFIYEHRHSDKYVTLFAKENDLSTKIQLSI